MHYRLVPTEQVLEVENIVRQAVARVHGMFVITTGAMVWEIRPHMAWHKGKAVLWLREQLALDDALTIYIADDQTDEDAFAALRDAITVKVGVGQPTQAKYFVYGPTDVAEFLGWLGRDLKPRTPTD